MGAGGEGEKREEGRGGKHGGKEEKRRGGVEEEGRGSSHLPLEALEIPSSCSLSSVWL